MIASALSAAGRTTKRRLAERLLRTEWGLLTVRSFAEAAGEALVDRGTDVVIEGFPRSSNTFAVIAFRVAQRPTAVRIAHHSHALGQIKRAVRLGRPTIVLLRDPVDAVASLLVRDPSAHPAAALANYTAMYRGVAAMRSAVVIAPFDTVTRDYGSVIAAANDRFGTAFRPYRNTPELDAEVFAAIDGHNRRFERGRAAMLARPTQDRARDIGLARDRVLADPRIRAARQVHDRLA